MYFGVHFLNGVYFMNNADPTVLWKEKKEELKREGIKNPVIDRMIDSYFKYLKFPLEYQ